MLHPLALGFILYQIIPYEWSWLAQATHGEYSRIKSQSGLIKFVVFAIVFKIDVDDVNFGLNTKLKELTKVQSTVFVQIDPGKVLFGL